MRWTLPGIGVIWEVAPAPTSPAGIGVIMSGLSNQSKVLLVCLFAAAVPCALSFGVQAGLGSNMWIQEPIHEIVEVAGSCIALGVAVLLLLRIRHDKTASHLVWVAAALVIMGLMDGLHAVLAFGRPWSWLRHGSTFFGGIVFGLIWVPLSSVAVRRRNWLVLGFASLAIGVSAGMALFPRLLPNPWEAAQIGDYGFLAKAANGLGGLGCLAATIFFFRRYARNPRREDLVFASLTLLFATAGLLFGFSHVWNPDWWVWHLARLCAYGVVLIAAYGMVLELYRNLADSAAELEHRVNARTAELTSTALFPEENPFPVLRAKFDRTLVYANRSARPLLREWDCEIGSRVPEQLLDVMMSALQRGERRETELAVGDKVYSLVVVPITARDYINFYAMDVTERKRAEEGLRQREERFRALISASSEVMYQMNPDWSELRLLYGGGVLADVSQPVRDWLEKYIYEEDQAQVLQAVREAIRTKGVFNMEHRVLRKDGSVGWTASRAVPLLNAKGEIAEWFGASNNITERKQAEDALRRSEAQLTQAVGVGRLGIFEHDHVCETLHYSPLMRELIGFGPTEEVTLEGFLQRVVPEDRPGLAREIRRAHDPSGDGTFAVGYRVKVPGGGARWVSVRSQTYFQGEGSQRHALRTVGAVLDVTEQKESQARLEKLVAERTAKLQELVAELEHFSYTITHDMRAPLRAMQGFAEIMKETCTGCDKGQGVGFLQRIQTSASRMDSLITDALSYTHAVRQELPLEPVDAGALLRGMLDSYPEFQASRATITLEENIPELMGNEAGLTQCFSNLLGNAVKFVKPGQKPTIRVWHEQRAEWVRIWIEDNGIGISEYSMTRLFQMFSRGHNHGYEGTGIGLALVRKVVERMGGRVGVDSQDGIGSRFWVELRRAPTERPTLML